MTDIQHARHVDGPHRRRRDHTHAAVMAGICAVGLLALLLLGALLAG